MQMQSYYCDAVYKVKQNKQNQKKTNWHSIRWRFIVCIAIMTPEYQFFFGELWWSSGVTKQKRTAIVTQLC